MNKWVVIIAILAVAFSLLLKLPASPQPQTNERNNKDRKKAAPYEYFMQQRMYPDTVFDDAAYKSAMRAVRNDLHSRSRASGFNAQWQLQGPGNIGGRINCVAVHPLDQNYHARWKCCRGDFQDH